MQGFKEQQQIILWSKEYWKISSPTVTLLSLGLLCNTTYYTTDQTTKDMWSLCNRWSQDFTLNWILTKISFQKKSDILLFHNIFTPSVYLSFSKHKCVTLIELMKFALSKIYLPYNKVFKCFRDLSSLMMVTLINFMFRNFFKQKQHYTASFLNSGCFHHNFTGNKHYLSVYLQNNCPEFVGKSALNPWADKLLYIVTSLSIASWKTLSSLT